MVRPRPLNLEAEVLEQLEALLSTSRIRMVSEGSGTLAARLEYANERLRLLYVGITRAKKDLIITWNTGRQGNQTQSLALAELTGWWHA